MEHAVGPIAEILLNNSEKKKSKAKEALSEEICLLTNTRQRGKCQRPRVRSHLVLVN